MPNTEMPAAADRGDPIRSGRLLPRASPALWTAMRYLAISRLVVSLLTLAFFMFGDVSPFFESAGNRHRFLVTAFAYAGLALLFLLTVSQLRRGFSLQLIAHVATDLIVLGLLIYFAGGLRSGLGVLAVVAVAGGAILATPLLSMAFAAAASLLLLLEASTRMFGSDGLDSSVLLAPGLIGATCFGTAYVLNWLAARLEREERLAAQRGEELRRQLAITQLVIAELHQGVLVVARDGRVQTYNRVASSLLGPLAAPSQSLLEGPPGQGWAQIGRVFREWLSWPLKQPRPESIEISITPWQLPGQSARGQAKVKLRFLSAPSVLPSAAASEGPAMSGRDGVSDRDGVGDDVVLVIEDLRALEERAQQLKLASMGRLSASIAHEIRNPLGAIRHANSLLAEQLTLAPMQRLAGIVETNTVRINRIVEDVLSISRREAPTQEAIDLGLYLPAFLDEFATIAGCDPTRLAWSVATSELLRFDANHLRQVLVNILSNALRYASGAPAAVRIEWLQGKDDRLELHIADDGPGLAPEVMQHVFEPFFTTEARGTGLGLYLAREMCSANGAVLRYERESGEARYRGAFVIESTVRRDQVADPSASG